MLFIRIKTSHAYKEAEYELLFCYQLMMKLANRYVTEKLVFYSDPYPRKSNAKMISRNHWLNDFV